MESARAHARTHARVHLYLFTTEAIGHEEGPLLLLLLLFHVAGLFVVVAALVLVHFGAGALNLSVAARASGCKDVRV